MHAYKSRTSFMLIIIDCLKSLFFVKELIVSYMEEKKERKTDRQTVNNTIYLLWNRHFSWRANVRGFPG